MLSGVQCGAEIGHPGGLGAQMGLKECPGKACAHQGFQVRLFCPPDTSLSLTFFIYKPEWVVLVQYWGEIGRGHTHVAGRLCPREE